MERIQLKIALPFLNKSPYLDQEINMSFSLPENHFLILLGKHYEKEVKLSQKENEESDKKSISEKIKEGNLLELVEVVSLEDGEIQVDISNVACNIGSGAAIRIKDLKTGMSYSGTSNKSDGEKLSFEAYINIGVGGMLRIERHFSAFNNWMEYGINDYYRFLRTQENVELVDKKLNNRADAAKHQIQLVESRGNLDKSQIDAFNQCLNQGPVTLIQGPPGTGKTTFAAQLSKYLLDQGFEVMVTAFTHDAINNILERIQKLGAPVSKIGKKSKCSESLRPFRRDTFSTYGKVKTVVGMTIHELLKNHKKFDFILVDEASQMDIVSGIHFLASSTKTIFIGDHMQLPNIPKISNTEFSISIFDLLRKVYEPSSLLTTYRFNQRICNYISPNFYKGKLICGESVQFNHLEFPSELPIVKLKVLNRDLLENPLLFIHTEEEVEFLLNKEQANLIADLVEDFLSLGISKGELGIIAPNNMQVNFIKKVLSARKIEWKGIQIETVNKFQGQEKEVILYSSVITKIGSEKAKYDFFFDIRRFNVAISRAKKMAIVLGNRDLVAQAGSLLSGGEKIADFLNKSACLNLTSVN